MKRSLYDLCIAKHRFEALSEIEGELDYGRFVDFVNNRLDYFTWFENTERGKSLMKDFILDPESVDPIFRKLLKMTQANAEFSKNRGFYTFHLKWFDEGLIKITFESNVKKKHLQLALDLANELEALLLNNRKKIIDQAYIDTLPDD